MKFKKIFISSVLISVMGLKGVCFAKENNAKDATQELPEVVVTATRTETPITETPGSVTVITKKDIEIKNPKTIDEALNDIPGVLVKRGKGLMDTLARITLRGIPGQQRTLVMMDGIVLNNPYYGGIKIAGFFPENLEKIEVVKGPFSSLYGGYAMGGVVNFITKMPEKREFTLKSGYGSSFDRGEAMDDLRRFYISFGDKIANKFSFFISYGRHDTNGYPTNPVIRNSAPPAGILGYINSYDKYGNPVYIYGDKGDNTWWDDGITVKAQYDFSKDTALRLTFMRNRYKYDYDNPHTYLYNATTGQSLYYPKEYYYLAGSGGRTQNIFGLNFNTKILKNLLMKFNLSYLTTEKDWYISPSYGATISGGPGKLSDTIQNRYYIDLQFSLPLFTNQILTFGGSFIKDYANTKEKNLSDWRDETSTTTLKYQSKGKTQSYAIFIQDEIEISPNLTAYLGIREDWWKTYDGYVNQIGTTGYPIEYDSHSESCFSPKFAIVYKPFEKTTLKTSIGKAFRPPTVYELYRTWTSSYSGITYAGNPNLKPETVVSWDIGIEQKLWKGAKMEITYFQNNMKNLIYSKTVNATYQEKVNVGKAQSKGIEFSIEQKFRKWLKLFANFTYTDSEIKENDAKPSTEGKRLTYTPLWMGNIGAELKRGKFSAYIVGRYVDKMYGNDENKDKKSYVYGSYDEYFVVDASFSYKFNKFTTLSLTLNNIFDEDYYQYYKAPGRSWFAELSIKF
ncbi:TonB-dependent receptor [Thermodesulfobacterium hydrogeniphilum]|uniref:TonB-dependent receptor n=1 Tax=Thermodesulfobacterium hydrogeniphilum TaxID=161156 RepID=UPI00056F7932|nr:TonB-dependent receptor [Thermodesulfobacterium hydrogeniphilum]